MKITNKQVEAAHTHILATEKTSGVRWSKVDALTVLRELWWIRSDIKAREVLAAIDDYGFDEWAPRN